MSSKRCRHGLAGKVPCSKGTPGCDVAHHTNNRTEKYLIWSIEHDGWWKPGEVGYTRELACAGLYDHGRAAAIVARANIVEFHECMIPVECLDLTEMKKLAAELRERTEVIEKRLE